MCLWIYQGGRFPFSLELSPVYRTEDKFLYHHNFRRDIKTLLFGDSKKNQAQIILLSKAVQTFITNGCNINSHFLFDVLCSNQLKNSELLQTMV